MKAYVFFIVVYNDFDNIAPIIYYLAKNGNSKIYICFYGIDLRYTDLFKYLEKNVGDSLQVFTWSPKKKNFVSNISIRVFNKIINILNLRKNFPAKSNFAPKNIIGRWLESMTLYEYRRVVVVFDRALNPVVDYVRHYLKKMDSIFVSCPHGPRTDINRMTYDFQTTRSTKNEDFKRYYPSYEYVIFSDHLELEYNEKFYLPDTKEYKPYTLKREVLGSIRYCPEWLNHVDIFTHKLREKKDKKIKAVFFMKHFKHNVFAEEVQRTIELFADFPDIDFYIKPHTRGMPFSSKVNVQNIHIVCDTTSSSLINMADLILFYGGTSIILEPLAKKKLVACIDYLDCNRNVYEYFNACHILKCRDDLCFFLDSVVAREVKPISGECVLKKIVHAGDYSMTVPERYINFFENL